MISFIVNALFVIVGLFLVTIVLSLMAWVVLRLLRLLFPQRFGKVGKRSKPEPVQAMKITPEQFKNMFAPQCNTESVDGELDPQLQQR